MLPHEKRQIDKLKIVAARTAAKTLLLAHEDCILRIDHHAHVTLVEGGAFVEAMIFVPDSLIKVTT